jgi:hypothetical protein
MLLSYVEPRWIEGAEKYRTAVAIQKALNIICTVVV